jgi:hypothetical protein
MDAEMRGEMNEPAREPRAAATANRSHGAIEA